MRSRWRPRWVTLRVRLTAWYMLLMALTLLFFSGYLYFFSLATRRKRRTDWNLKVA